MGFSITSERKTCAFCGAEHELTWVSQPMRDKDSVDCKVCGKVLHAWNGASTCTAELVKPGGAPKP